MHMERFLDYVLRQLIEFPDELVILKDEAPKKTVYRIQVRQTDIGKVVGKHGSTIAAIRNLVAAAAAKHGVRATVEIMEDHPPRADRPPVQPQEIRKAEEAPSQE
jgi:predicted RNA-binding protein YlqC (UPF0109 family)